MIQGVKTPVASEKHVCREDPSYFSMMVKLLCYFMTQPPSTSSCKANFPIEAVLILVCKNQHLPMYSMILRTEICYTD